MLWRASKRSRSRNAPAAFITPCRPIRANKAPSGELWAHEIKQDGYRLQIHVRDGRVRLYTMTGIDWTDRYPRIVASAARIKGSAILDAEAVCPDADGVADFAALHSRVRDWTVIAHAFDLMMLDGEDMRRLPWLDRKAALRKLLRRWRTGLHYVEHVTGDGPLIFQHAYKLGLEGIVSKRIDAPYRSGSCRAWIKIKNPKAPAVLRIVEG